MHEDPCAYSGSLRYLTGICWLILWILMLHSSIPSDKRHAISASLQNVFNLHPHTTDLKHGLLTYNLRPMSITPVITEKPSPYSSLNTNIRNKIESMTGGFTMTHSQIA